MGDEPLHLQEYAKQLRHCAHQHGFNERSVLTIDNTFDWSALAQHTQHLSLFAKRRFWELYISKLSPAGAEFLMTYAQQPPADILLLLIIHALDSKKQQRQWLLSLEQTGVIVQVRPLDAEQLPAWIQQRLQQHQLQATPQAIELMAQRSVGHLSACAQEIEKLSLLYEPHSTLDVEQIRLAFADNARFEVFEWVDTVFMGDIAKAIRQFNRLQQEGVDIILLIWVLHKELSTLCRLSHALHAGQDLEALFKYYRLGQRRKPMLRQALNRYSTERWQQFLCQLVEIEPIAKGIRIGRCWDELFSLTGAIAGIQ